MKKLIIPLFILLFLFNSSLSFAQNSTPDAKLIERVNYDLPYPGILPDSPLYFLKAVRDNLIGFFITDPLKKAEYNLLQADKRLEASQKLYEKKKYDLSITTLSNSGNYFYYAIEKAAEAKKQGEDVNPLLQKLLNASKKHQEIILNMKDSLKDKRADTYQTFFERARSFQDKVQQVMHS